MSGLQGSGKSTYANNLVSRGGWRSINYDSLRHYDSQGQPVVYRFSRESEDKIHATAMNMAERWLKLGYSIVIDNMNLSDRQRQPWYDLADSHKAHYEVVEMSADLDTCLARNSLRTGWARVPRPVIERAALWNNKIVWPVDQKVAIIDIDGTLADSSTRVKYLQVGPCDTCSGSKEISKCKLSKCTACGVEKCPACNGRGKKKKDWMRFYQEVGNDKVRVPVAEWVRQLRASGNFYIVIVSGRPLDQAGNQTVDWLDKNNIPYDRIFMRNRGDFRKDTIIKQEILDKITPHIDVAFAIDDRPSVIRMWRENGVTCYDVGDGLEF